MSKFYFFYCVVVTFYCCNTQVRNTVNSNPQLLSVGNDLEVGDQQGFDSRDSVFLPFWNYFKTTVIKFDGRKFKALCFDSLICKQHHLAIGDFMKHNFAEVFDDTLKQRLTQTKAIEFIDSQIDPIYLPLFVRKYAMKGKMTIKLVNIKKISDYPNGPVIVVLKFLKSGTGYKLYGYDRFG